VPERNPRRRHPLLPLRRASNPDGACDVGLEGFTADWTGRARRKAPGSSMRIRTGARRVAADPRVCSCRQPSSNPAATSPRSVRPAWRNLSAPGMNVISSDYLPTSCRRRKPCPEAQGNLLPQQLSRPLSREARAIAQGA
jgi:hypothetical protein